MKEADENGRGSNLLRQLILRYNVPRNRRSAEPDVSIQAVDIKSTVRKGSSRPFFSNHKDEQVRR
jgi:hypothetical protein